MRTNNPIVARGYKKAEIAGEDSIPAFMEAAEENLADIALENAFAYFYMMDAVSKEILFMSKSVQNVLGFGSNIVVGKGPAFLDSRIHPADRKKMDQIRRKISEHFYAAASYERKRLKFEFNIRMSRSDGHVLHLLHQVSYLETTASGEPLITYHTVTDISRYKQDNTIKLTIYGMQNHCHKKLFEYDLYEESLLTKRQNEILKLISEGLTSVEIGLNLGISMETVKNHRKKILQGMQAKNMMEAIRMRGKF